MSCEITLTELAAVSDRQVLAVRRGDIDGLTALEAERSALIARLAPEGLAELAGRRPDRCGELVARIQENDRLTRSALRQRLDQLGAELGRHGARRRAEQAYLRMSQRG